MRRRAAERGAVMRLWPGREAARVNPALRAPLMREAAWPDHVQPAPASAHAQAANLQVDGDPPGGRFLPGGAVPARPREAFVVPGGLGLPALAFVNLRRERAGVELWELDAAAPPAFVRQRPADFDLGRGDPGDLAVIEALALPRQQALVVLRQERPRPHATLHRIDIVSNGLHALGRIEPDPFADPPAPHLGVLQLTPDTLLVLHRTGAVRLGRWGDATRANHLVLYSPREREGLALLSLPQGDGNVSHWGLAGTRLWLQAVDGRLRPRPRIHFWSLDLAAVL